jgi:hypothetical protein
MKTNEILAEIRRTRDDLARETGYDLARLFDYVRAEEAKARARGVKFAPVRAAAEPSSLLREEPPQS